MPRTALGDAGAEVMAGIADGKLACLEILAALRSTRTCLAEVVPTRDKPSMAPSAHGGVGGRDSNGPAPHRWWLQKRIGVLAIPRDRRRRAHRLCLDGV